MPYKRFNKKFVAIFGCVVLLFAMAVTGITCSIVGTGTQNTNYTPTQTLHYDTRPACYIGAPVLIGNNTMTFNRYRDSPGADGTMITGAEWNDMMHRGLGKLPEWPKTYTINIHATSTSVAEFNNVRDFWDAVVKADPTLPVRISNGEIDTIRFVACDSGTLLPGNPASIAQQLADVSQARV